MIKKAMKLTIKTSPSAAKKLLTNMPQGHYITLSAKDAARILGGKIWNTGR
jgi:hypothetical protein